MLNENLVTVPGPRRLGRLPLKMSRKALQFSDFFKYLKLPAKTYNWTRRKPIPIRTYGNLQYGDCTRAKQAVAASRMEKLEQNRLIEITDDEIIRVYREMCIRVYGSDADNGAYEDDALSAWRNPEYTFRDTAGNPYTIDAYLRINAKNIEELKAGLALSGAKGIAVCLNLPAAFASIEPPTMWHVPEGQPLIGEWMPGSWGGHSMWAHDYNANGIVLDHTWDLQPQIVTWEAVAAYLDEAHLVIDSVDAWRKNLKGTSVGKLNMGNIIDAVNAVSSFQITGTK